MKRLLKFLLPIFLSAAAFADGAEIQVESQDSPTPWTHLELANDPENFQFAIVTDRTGGARRGVFQDAIGKLNILQPEFVMSIGDLIEGYTEDLTVIQAQWNRFDRLVSRLKMPFFYLPGNHDYTNRVMANIWAERYGAAYYHFLYQNVLFLCLNSEDPLEAHRRGAILEEQYQYIKRVLADNVGVKWTLVFLHQPLWLQQDTGRWKDIERLLASRKHTVFAGHYHNYTKYVRNESRYVVLATTGGTSQLRGPNYGEFDHVVWVTMTDGGPTIANLMLDGIWDENVRDEAFANYMEAMIQRRYLKIESFVIREGTGPDHTIKVNVTNPVDGQMQFTGRLRKNPIILKRTALNKKIEPNAIKQFDLNVEIDSQGDLDKHLPLHFVGVIRFKVKGRPDVVIRRLRKIGVSLPSGSELIEAEDMALEGYRAVYLPNGRGMIAVAPSRPPITGRAVEVFHGHSGTYRMTMVAIPEKGGSPMIKLFVQDRLVFHKRVPPVRRRQNLQSDRLEFSIPAVVIRRGDEIRLEGTADGSAYARVDRLVFSPERDVNVVNP